MLKRNRFGWIWHDDINMIIPDTRDGQWLYKYFVFGFCYCEEKRKRVRHVILKKLKKQKKVFASYIRLRRNKKLKKIKKNKLTSQAGY